MTETPRARRRRKDARPSEIVEAGFLEFSENGFHGARLDNVAKRAGISKGTIYLYFDGKEALFEAAVRSRVLPVQDEARAMVDAHPGPVRDLLRDILRMMYTATRRDDVAVILRIIVAEGPRFPAVAESHYRESIRGWRALLDDVIRRGIGSGEIREGPVSRLPMVIFAPALMASLWRMTFARYDPISEEAFIEAHLDLLDRGLFAK